MTSPASPTVSTAEPQEFYCDAIQILLDAGTPFLIGGGHALLVHTGVSRATKDLDFFIERKNVERALSAFQQAGYQAEIPFTHWLAKAHSGERFVDLIFNSGNGCCPVDAGWFEHARPTNVLGLPVMLCPPEEILWQKAFIMERERYDGADVAHLLRACGATLDWKRLLDRFGPHWRVLLAHLVLFEFIYPAEQSPIPRWLIQDLIARVQNESRSTDRNRLCCGTLLSREQYLVDVTEWGCTDARLTPAGGLTPEQIANWTPPKAA